MAKLYIIRGLPGSGKSTFARKMIDRGMADSYYEADMYFLDKDGNYNFNPSKLGNAHAWCKAKVLADLKAGKNVIVSNTFTHGNEMEPYITYCMDNKIPFEVIRLQTQFQSIHNVPSYAIDKMKARFQNFNGETIIK